MNQTYQPEVWAMTKDSVYDAQEALQIGLENTRELLAEHDFRLGRTTRSNRTTAERLEEEIAKIESAMEGISNPNGGEL